MDDFNALLYGSELVQSAWSRLTRVSYQAWVTAYSTFCHEWHRQPLPVDPDFFICWLERLVTKLAGRTVTVAVSAIVAWCALNNLAHPIKAHPILHLAWKALVRTRSVRVTPQKLPLSENFVLAVYRDFMRHHSPNPWPGFSPAALGCLAPHGLRVWPTGPRVLQLYALQSLASLGWVCGHALLGHEK